MHQVIKAHYYILPLRVVALVGKFGGVIERVQHTMHISIFVDRRQAFSQQAKFLQKIVALNRIV